MTNDVAERSGFLVINKPSNWTSFDVIAKLRAITGIRNIGHTGTLDPFASGVLICGFNKARFLVDIVQAFDKTYRGRIRLGQTSDTDDVDGHKTTVAVTTKPTEAQVNAALELFTGNIEQLPPPYSALRVQGRRMYELARKGLPIKRERRRVIVHKLTLLAYTYPHIDIETRVSKGTYVRSLARDIGNQLKTGGFLEELVRKSVGPFTLEDSYEIGDVTKEKIGSMLIRLETVIDPALKIVLSVHDLERLAHGEHIKAPSNLSGSAAVPYLAVMDDHDQLLMLANYDSQEQSLVSQKIFDESLRR